jgi:hypothetical protein
VSADVAEAVWYSEDAAPPLTVSCPAAFGPGQLLVLVIVQEGGVIGDLTAPAGWAAGAGVCDISIEHGKVWSYEYSGGEPASWAFGYGSTSDCAAGLLRVTGAAVPSVLVVPTPTTSASNPATMASPSLDPPQDNDLLTSWLAIAGNDNAFSATIPSGMTDLGYAQFTTFQALAAAKEQLASSSATGTRTWTSISPTGQSACAFSVAIASAEAAGAGRRTPWNSSV